MIAHRLPGSTAQLIDSLVTDLKPVSRFAVSARLAGGMLVGAAAALMLLVGLLGARPRLSLFAVSAPFQLKLGYSLATAAASVFVVARMARPGMGRGLAWLLAVPLLLYLPAGIYEFIATPSAQRAALVLGSGWRKCTWFVIGLSIPVYLGLMWAFSKLAPTRLGFAGGVAGLCSASVAAAVYCIHCPTDAAVFALTWYTLAFGIASALGSLAGVRFFRW